MSVRLYVGGPRPLTCTRETAVILRRRAVFNFIAAELERACFGSGAKAPARTLR